MHGQRQANGTLFEMGRNNVERSPADGKKRGSTKKTHYNRQTTEKKELVGVSSLREVRMAYPKKKKAPS